MNIFKIMRRIAELRAFRQWVIDTPCKDDSWQASVDWLDNAIATHEADLDAIVRAA